MKLKLFVSYSALDTEFANEFIYHWLKILEREDYFEIWHNGKIPPGEEWNDLIRENLAKSDIILLLITAQFLSSDYIHSVELKEAIARHRKNEAKVIPIIVKPSPWKVTDHIKQLQVIPRNEIAILDADSSSKDNALNKVIEEIQIAVEQLGNSLKIDREIIENPRNYPHNKLDSGKEVPLFIDFNEHDINATSFVGSDLDNINALLDNEIMIDTIHAGNLIPKKFEHFFKQESFNDLFIEEKDWGANYIAYELARELGLSGFYKVNIARSLLDYGRFPGSTNSDSRKHMTRLSINPPFSELLTFREKQKLLEEHYDQISQVFEKNVEGKTLKIAIHTYDQYNSAPLEEDRTERPPISVVYRSQAYQENHRMPFGIFDKLYIHELGEFTADRKIAARISLNLEKVFLTVAQNHPYTLPAGSVEERSQVQAFFKYLMKNFKLEITSLIKTELRGNQSIEQVYREVENMLTDTNLRNGNAEILRSYIHMYRKPPVNYENYCRNAQAIYDILRKFVKDNKEEILSGYRFSPKRLSSLAVEIRKDLVWNFTKMEPRLENIKKIAHLLAQAIKDYYKIDKHSSTNNLYTDMI